MPHLPNPLGIVLTSTYKPFVVCQKWRKKDRPLLIIPYIHTVPRHLKAQRHLNLVGKRGKSHKVSHNHLLEIQGSTRSQKSRTSRSATKMSRISSTGCCSRNRERSENDGRDMAVGIQACLYKCIWTGSVLLIRGHHIEDGRGSACTSWLGTPII